MTNQFHFNPAIGLEGPRDGYRYRVLFRHRQIRTEFWQQNPLPHASGENWRKDSDIIVVDDLTGEISPAQGETLTLMALETLRRNEKAATSD